MGSVRQKYLLLACRFFSLLRTIFNGGHEHCPEVNPLRTSRVEGSSKTKQSVLDLTSPGKRALTRDIKIVESKTLDTVIANVFYENALPFNVADSSSFAVMLSNVSNSVNNIQVENTKYLIDDE